MTVADSDVLIEALRGRGSSAGRVASELERGRLATTVITVFELLAGAGTERERSKVERLLAAMAILPLDETASREAARIRLSLAGVGRTIGTADMLIAGICLAHSAVLLTRNRGHFERIPQLELGDLE